MATRPSPWAAAAARWLVACVALCGGVAATAPHPVHAQPEQGQVLERRVKAAFLYKFLGYAEFPASAFADPAAPITIAVAGSDELEADLSAITAGRNVNGRPIAVRSLREGDNALVHLLFIAASECAHASKLIHSTHALLVVTDCDGGLQQGAAINFRIIDEHVRFDVALDAAERNGVKLSSRLLSVANHVQKGAP